MLKNYLVVAYRNIIRNKVTSGINILGLAIGLTCCLLIILYISDELAFDGFHAKKERIFRVLTIDRALGVSSNLVGITMPPLGPALKDETPEVLESVRASSPGRQLLRYGDKSAYAERRMFTESALFTVFDFGLTSGDPGTALDEPNTAVITQELARKVFGDEDPMGKTLEINGPNDLLITGVLEPVKGSSHLDFDLLVSIHPNDPNSGIANWLKSWGSISMITYVELNDPASMATVNAAIEPLIRRNNVSDNFSAVLQPLNEVHLHSQEILFDTNNAKSDINYLYALGAVAVFVLLIACFNFMNLSTARSINRAREVGVRKVIGARRSQLIGQFIGESTLIGTAAFVISALFVELAGSAINATFHKQLELGIIANAPLLLALLGMALVVGVLAGLYPAIVLSRFEPVKTLKGSFKAGRSGTILRKSLVVVQFSASIAMIIGTGIVYMQVQFIMSKNMGYDREQVVAIPVGSPPLQQTLATLKNELGAIPSVISVEHSSNLPGRTFGRNGIRPEGVAEEDIWIVSVFSIGERFLETLGMELATGRNFSSEFGTDQAQAVLINEAAARELGWENPVGKKFLSQDSTTPDRTVVGVIKDFHFAPVRHKIEPLAIFFNPDNGGNVSVRIQAQDISGSLDAIRNVWSSINPNHPFEYTFLDDEFNQLYHSEAVFAQLVAGFAFLAIFTACLGLFGLAAFTAEQKTKEIGIRKVLGASVSGLVLMLTTDFLKLVLAANIIAWPAAYFAMRAWLDNYAYRIDLPWDIFLLSGLLALLVSLGTVGYQALKASLANPVQSLHYE